MRLVQQDHARVAFIATRGTHLKWCDKKEMNCFFKHSVIGHVTPAYCPNPPTTFNASYKRLSVHHGVNKTGTTASTLFFITSGGDDVGFCFGITAIFVGRLKGHVISAGTGVCMRWILSRTGTAVTESPFPGSGVVR